MSQLTENPQLMLEALVVLVKRAGGSVTIRPDEAPQQAFNLLSKFEPSVGLHLVIDAEPTPTPTPTENKRNE